jgi:hypothetical protein
MPSLLRDKTGRRPGPLLVNSVWGLRSSLDHTQQREYDDHDNHHDHDPNYALRIHLLGSFRKGAGLVSPAALAKGKYDGLQTLAQYDRLQTLAQLVTKAGATSGNPIQEKFSKFHTSRHFGE